MVLHAHIFFAAEAAADHLCDNPHFIDWQTGRFCAFFLSLVHTLITRIDDDPAFSVRHSHCCFRLQKGMFGRRHGIVVRNDIF